MLVHKCWVILSCAWQLWFPKFLFFWMIYCPFCSQLVFLSCLLPHLSFAHKNLKFPANDSLDASVHTCLIADFSRLPSAPFRRLFTPAQSALAQLCCHRRQEERPRPHTLTPRTSTHMHWFRSCFEKSSGCWAGLMTNPFQQPCWQYLHHQRELKTLAKMAENAVNGNESKPDGSFWTTLYFRPSCFLQSVILAFHSCFFKF